MKSAAQKEGIILNIISGYRSFDRQKDIWNRKFIEFTGTEEEKVEKIADFSAVPGMSRHHWGTEIDINSVNPADFEPSCKGTRCQLKVYEWLKSNARLYGFCQPYDKDRLVKTEPWHWTYKPISKQLTKQHTDTITANDLRGLGILGEKTIISNFNTYHKGFISNINEECIS